MLSYDCEQGGCGDKADGGDSFLLQEPKTKKKATPLVYFTTTSKQQQTLVTNIMRDTLSQNPREA